MGGNVLPPYERAMYDCRFAMVLNNGLEWDQCGEVSDLYTVRFGEVQQIMGITDYYAEDK